MTAVRISPVWADPGAVLDVIRSGGPFWPLANYAASDAEMAALGAQRVTFTPPWFRQDFALLGDTLIDGASLMLDNPRFVEAARTIAGPDAVVRPTTVYVNIMGPTPFPFPPHLDVPAFRGFTRADHPIWLLKVMMTSGLFERWRSRIATAVSWFYAGPGGDFHYWPHGPDAPGAVERAPFENVGVVADNEVTFHGVGPLGPPGSRMPAGLTHESRLVRGEGGWDVCDARGGVSVHYDDVDVRITVSWKADVLAGDTASTRVDEGGDLLDLDTVVDVFREDLRARGQAAPSPREPLTDQAWISTLAETYRDPAPTLVSRRCVTP